MVRNNLANRIRTSFVLAAVVSIAAVGTAAHADARHAEFDVMLRNVPITKGFVDIHVRVYVNEAVPWGGEVIYAVHGLAHTAATWQPLAEQLFRDPRSGPPVSQVVAVDLPGHGQSGLPKGVKFGNLVLEDYLSAVLGTLGRLRAMNVKPTAILGHSLGGLLIQMSQHQLLNSGTSLKEKYNIKTAVLLAAVPPARLPWSFAENGVALLSLLTFARSESGLGCFVNVSDDLWPFFFFTANPLDPLHTLVPGAPTPEDVSGLGYNAIEPLTSSLELVGGGLPRVPVSADIFGTATGTRLVMAAYEQDWLVNWFENFLLFLYLNGDPSGRFLWVDGDTAVHDLHVSAPATLVEALGGTAIFF